MLPRHNVAVQAAGPGSSAIPCRSDRRRSGPTWRPAGVPGRERQRQRRDFSHRRGKRPPRMPSNGRGDMRPALPVTHLAGRIVPDILKTQRAQNQSQRDRAGDEGDCSVTRKDPALVIESLELQRIAARIEEKECRLFAGQAFKTNAGLDDESTLPRFSLSPQASATPSWKGLHRNDAPELARRQPDYALCVRPHSGLNAQRSDDRRNRSRPIRRSSGLRDSRAGRRKRRALRQDRAPETPDENVDVLT